MNTELIEEIGNLGSVETVLWDDLEREGYDGKYFRYIAILNEEALMETADALFEVPALLAKLGIKSPNLDTTSAYGTHWVWVI